MLLRVFKRKLSFKLHYTIYTSLKADFAFRSVTSTIDVLYF